MREFDLIEARLQEENPQFRRIWVQYSLHRGKYRIVITVFFHDYSGYRMLFGEPKDLSWNSINRIFNENIHLIQ